MEKKTTVQDFMSFFGEMPERDNQSIDWEAWDAEQRAASEDASAIYIISGEGEIGTRELYTGKRTRSAMKARLTRECCGGDRWARYEDADGRQVYPEQY